MPTSEIFYFDTATVETAADVSWTNLSNLQANDGNQASVSLGAGQTADRILMSGNNINLNPNWIIRGVEVVYRNVTTTSSGGLGPDFSLSQCLFDDYRGNRFDNDYPLGESDILVTNQDVVTGETDINSTIGSFKWFMPFTAEQWNDADIAFLLAANGEGAVASTIAIDALGVRFTYEDQYTAQNNLPLTYWPTQFGPVSHLRAGSYNGQMYMPVFSSHHNGTNQELALLMWRTGDPQLGSWELLDEDNGPRFTQDFTSTPEWINAFDMVQVDSVLHIAFHSDLQSGTGSLTYCRFNLATGAWVTASEQEINTQSTTGVSSQPKTKISIEAYDNNEILIVYNGSSDKVMGGDKLRVDYAHYNGLSWSVDQAMDAAGDIHYGCPVVCQSTVADEYHIVWYRQTATSNDPPTSWSDLEGRTYETAGLAPTTAQQSITHGINGAVLNMNTLLKTPNRFLAFLSDGNATASNLRIWECTENGATDRIQFSSIRYTSNWTPNIRENTPTEGGFLEYCVAYDEAEDRIYVVYISDGTNDYDIYMAYSDDDASSFSTPIVIVTHNDVAADSHVLISASIVNHGQGKALVITTWYDNYGVVYNEYPLNPILPFKAKINDARRRNTLLRM